MAQGLYISTRFEPAHPLLLLSILSALLGTSIFGLALTIAQKIGPIRNELALALTLSLSVTTLLFHAAYYYFFAAHRRKNVFPLIAAAAIWLAWLVLAGVAIYEAARGHPLASSSNSSSKKVPGSSPAGAAGNRNAIPPSLKPWMVAQAVLASFEVAIFGLAVVLHVLRHREVIATRGNRGSVEMTIKVQACSAAPPQHLAATNLATRVAPAAKDPRPPLALPLILQKQILEITDQGSPMSQSPVDTSPKYNPFHPLILLGIPSALLCMAVFALSVLSLGQLTPITWHALPGLALALSGMTLLFHLLYYFAARHRRHPSGLPILPAGSFFTAVALWLVWLIIAVIAVYEAASGRPIDPSPTSEDHEARDIHEDGKEVTPRVVAQAVLVWLEVGVFGITVLLFGLLRRRASTKPPQIQNP
ncbi:hypothetical protein H0H81_000118 [Sphagnurus paluster]|uniref:Uncharacterized protein n=1 Tax=Sphagnurus paluster TaxID=117069 RepID=A0A9P7GNR8_9AGAR|nr:hypothetical protein H0H81_000118 [Sphagnurus paluster]